MRYKRLYFQVVTFSLMIIFYFSILSSSFIRTNPQFQITGEITRISSSNQEEILKPIPRKIIEISPSEYIGLWYYNPLGGNNLYQIGYSTNAINWTIIDVHSYFLRSVSDSDCIVLDNGTLLIYELYRYISNTVYSPHLIRIWSIKDFNSTVESSFKKLCLNPNDTSYSSYDIISKYNNTDFDNVRFYYDHGLYMCSISLNNTIKIWSLSNNLSTFSQISSYQLKNQDNSHIYFFLTKIDHKLCIFLQNTLIFHDQEGYWQEYPIDGLEDILTSILITSGNNLYLIYYDHNTYNYYLGQLILNSVSQQYFLSNPIMLLSSKVFRENLINEYYHHGFAQIETLMKPKIFFPIAYRQYYSIPNGFYSIVQSYVFLYEESMSPNYKGLVYVYFLTILSILILFLPEKFYPILMNTIQKLRKEIR